MKLLNSVKITVLKRFKPEEVFEKCPVTRSTPMQVCNYFKDGQEFVVDKQTSDMPVGFCPSAWASLWPFVVMFGFGAKGLPWNKEGVGILCCTDGLRPVVFRVEGATEAGRGK